MINVTKPYLPNKQKFLKYIDEIYDSYWLTNRGPLVQKLEKRLAKYLGVRNLILVSNGTVALDIAYMALELTGEVITTPFSFVATTSSLVTNGLKPIFADIDPNGLNIDPNNIEQKITNQTSAILPVHVFGNACDVDAIQKIAQKNGLKVIYDAAQAFSVQYNGQSVLNYGDISTLSFHATKLFHTIEGGAIIVNDDNLVEKVRRLTNFGIENAETILDVGTNAKMNEFEAAMGLCVLDEMDEVTKRRQAIHERYEKGLSDLVEFQKQNEKSTANYNYFPVLLKDEAQVRLLQKVLNQVDVYPRRYFYPSLDTLNYIKDNQYCKISRNVASRILVLPQFPDLDVSVQMSIIEIIKKELN